jgi:hypothetical protein
LRHGAFFQGPLNTAFNLSSVERLPAPVALNNHKGLVFYPLIACETISAVIAFSSAADSLSVCQSPRLNYFIIKVSTMRAAHNSISYKEMDKLSTIPQATPLYMGLYLY